MSSFTRHPRRESTSGTPTSPASPKDGASALTKSLGQLSLDPVPVASKSERPENAHPDSASVSPTHPLSQTSPLHSPRSPLAIGSASRRASRAGTPPLLRKASMNSLHSASGSTTARTLSRRASSGHLLSPTSSQTPTVEEKPQATANSIANDYFRAELEMHHGRAAAGSHTNTVVILNDAVYGHRFSRPRTSRGALSTIVERPERIKASVLGIATAYVRLGGRHSQGDLPIRPDREIHDIDSLPFRIHKTTRRLSLSSAAVTNVHGTKWMDELRLMCDSAESRLAMGGRELQRPDIARGVDHAAPQKLHEGDLYLCAESLGAIEGALGAVCDAVDTVFGDGPRRAFVGIRPPGHHCSASLPSGFCWVNNVHVGIMHGILGHGLTHAAIIDFDLHHGDGSQAITWQHNSRANAASKSHASWKKTSIGYFSLHDINSYPCELGDEDKVKNASLCIDNAHGQTIWNAHLQSWKTEKEFWDLYETTYSVLLKKARSFLFSQSQKLRESNLAPKAAIFFSAGFDASEWESAGMQRHQVNVPTEFYARLTSDVVNLASEEGLAVDGRVISVLEGGYSDRALISGILSHLSGMVVGHETRTAATGREDGRLAYEMGQRQDVFEPDQDSKDDSAAKYSFDPAWWASAQLDQLEQPAEPASSQKKPRYSTPPTYSSPTQASFARVSDPIRMRRSLSNLSLGRSKPPQRPHSPPPPEVSWLVAAKELCNVLIPSDRQTDSCRPEDLNAEASRIRRNRQSGLFSNATPFQAEAERPPSRKSLRERKPRAIGSIDEEASKSLPKPRRKPNVTPVTSPIKSARSTPQPTGASSTGRPGRRLSGVSVKLSPPREEPSPLLPIPATAPVPRRTTTSRPGSRAGRAQSSDKVPVGLKKQASTARREPATKAPGSPSTRATTPGQSRDQAVTEATTPTPSTGLQVHAVHKESKDDMNSLTAGVKKIRINLITPSRREAMRRANEEASAVHRSEAHPDATATQTEDSPTNHINSPNWGTAGPNASSQTAPEIAARQPLEPSSMDEQVSMSGDEEACSSSAMTSSMADSFATAVSSLDTPSVVTQPAGKTADVLVPNLPEDAKPVATSQQEFLEGQTPTPPRVSTSTSAAGPEAVGRSQNSLFEYKSGIPFAPMTDKTNQETPGHASQQLPGGFENRPSLTATHHSLWQVPNSSQK